MDFMDTLTLDAPRRTNDGYLTASVRAARTGIQIYSGREVDPKNEHGLRDMATVRVYRAPEVVFEDASRASLAYKPVTNDHPPEGVTADNWSKYAVGIVGGEIAKDGDYIRVPLALMDGAAIKAVEGGKNQLSCGYTCDVFAESGTTPDGQIYDAVQKNLRYNHLSVVGLARGGPSLKIGDENPMTLKTITVDGIPVEVTDAAATVIATLQGRIATADAAHATALADANTRASTAEARAATLDAEIATLKAAQLTGDKLDAAVAERSQLLADAKRIGGDKLDPTGDNASIKKRAVLAKLGDTYATKDAAFFDAAFTLQVDALTADTGANVLADAVRQIKPTADAATAAAAAKKKRNAEMASAWN